MHVQGAALCCRRREAESQRDRLQEQLDQAQAEAQVLREALEAERSAAAADAASMQHRLEQEGASACKRARNEAASEWQERLQKHAQQSDAVLAEKSAALEVRQSLMLFQSPSVCGCFQGV